MSRTDRLEKIVRLQKALHARADVLKELLQAVKNSDELEASRNYINRENRRLAAEGFKIVNIQEQYE